MRKKYRTHKYETWLPERHAKPLKDDKQNKSDKTIKQEERNKRFDF